MTYDEFLEKYKPVNNHLKLHAPFDNKMFETYNSELAFVKSNLKNNTVWTIVDGDNNELLVISGFHYVNRFGYFITEEPYEEENIEILID